MGWDRIKKGMGSLVREAVDVELMVEFFCSEEGRRETEMELQERLTECHAH